jgi:hypothetical protein
MLPEILDMPDVNEVLEEAVRCRLERVDRAIERASGEARIEGAPLEMSPPPEHPRFAERLWRESNGF